MRDSSVAGDDGEGSCHLGKGRPPKEIYDPKYISWGAAEYVANCHIGGALSEYNKDRP